MISLKLNNIIICIVLSIIGRSHAAFDFVDPNVVLKDKFEGWGTSLAWWGDMVGGMDQEVADHVVDALFSPSKLNFNIARYVIGGTTPGNYTCGEYRAGAATESYKDGFDSPYNWDRDMRQRKILQMAKDAGANLFEAFSNTPPQWMTISGCSKGTNFPAPLFPNFNAANADHFADYATEVIKHFHDELNITFTTYSPFNEPYGLHGIGGWIGPSQQQEGCNMGRPTMVTVIKSVHEALAAKNLSSVKIAISDETQINTQILTYDNFAEAGINELFHQVNVHGYWDDGAEVNRRDVLSSRCDQRGHDLWMDEMGWGGTPPDDMGQGLNIANRIMTDLKTMIPSAWVYWQAVEDVGAWGLLDVPYEDPTVDKIRYNNGYYATEQFSQHIRQGYKLIYVSDHNTLGALSDDNQKLILVTVNPEATNLTLNFDLSRFDSLGTVKLFRTSASEQHLDLPPPTLTSENELELNCPPQSVSTLEFSNVAFGNVVNLIENGDFESVEQTENGVILPTAWSLLQGENEEVDGVDGVTGENPWRGNFSGTIELGPQKNFLLSQTVNLGRDPPSNSSALCSYYLSAWCSSTRQKTLLAAVVNESRMPGEYQVNENGLFNSYGLSFSARADESVRIIFATDFALLGGTAKIDNVHLHRKCA